MINVGNITPEELVSIVTVSIWHLDFNKQTRWCGQDVEYLDAFHCSLSFPLYTILHLKNAVSFFRFLPATLFWYTSLQSGLVMQSLTEEIQSFSRTRLRKQCTRVTSLSGRRIVETWKGSTITVVEDPSPPERMLGYVPDTSWDLQVGTVRPYLLLGEWYIVTDSTTYKLNTNHCLIIWTNSLVVLLLMGGTDKLSEPVTQTHFAFTSKQKNVFYSYSSYFCHYTFGKLWSAPTHQYGIVEKGMYRVVESETWIYS